MEMKPDLVIDENGNKKWYWNGDYHREDGPAIEYSNGTRAWFRQGDMHREDGPAFEGSDGRICWYLTGICYDFEEWIELLDCSDVEKLEFYLKWK